jgi:spermidine synthase
MNMKRIVSFFLPLQIEALSSEYNHFLEVELKNGRYLLNSERVNYSYGSLHAVFKRVFRDIQVEKLELSNCLVLGLGGGSVISLLRKDYHLSMPITAVEIDAAVLELGAKYFEINSYQDLDIIHEDAFEYVKKSEQIYDLIIVDVYINDKVPFIFHTEEFITNLKASTHKKTIILFNKMLNSPGATREYNELVYEMAEAFGSVSFLSYIMYGTENRIVCVNLNHRAIAENSF